MHFALCDPPMNLISQAVPRFIRIIQSQYQLAIPCPYPTHPRTTHSIFYLWPTPMASPFPLSPPIVYCHTTTAMHEIEYISPIEYPTPLLPSPLSVLPPPTSVLLPPRSYLLGRNLPACAHRPAGCQTVGVDG